MNENTLIEHAKQINEATSALIEMEAMKAENRQRELNGQSLAWGFADFQCLLETYGLGYNGCIVKLGRF